ncbi:MAG TPA: purine/pyrimidine permease, partial [Clostridia bacterium]|nr:purine/pyrimidine permease [Clostridia bacterium]
NILSSLQWFIFMLSTAVIMPVAVGAAFQFSPVEMASIIRYTLLVVGVSSLLQIWFGHGLPIAEGPSAMWWAVFLIFAELGPLMPNGTAGILQSIEMGIIISGILFIVLSLFKVINLLSKVFTPIVVGTFLVLLVAQLSGAFINQLLGIGYLSESISMRVALPAIFVVILSIIFSRSRFTFLKVYSVLFSLTCGWILFALLGLTKSVPMEASSLIMLPELFSWGAPRFDIGVVITSMLTALMVLTNQITSIQVAERVVERPAQQVYNRSGFILGINQILAGMISAIPSVAMTLTAGFIETTKMRDRLPFIVGGVLISLISFFPFAMLFFASLPVPVAYGALFLSFSSMIGLALKEFSTVEYNENNLFVIGFSLMLGIGSMFVPEKSLQIMPACFIPVLKNGLILGVMSCIFLEQMVKYKGFAKKVVKLDKGKSVY